MGVYMKVLGCTEVSNMPGTSVCSGLEWTVIVGTGVYKGVFTLVC